MKLVDGGGKSASHFSTIDSLRGMAALLVCLFHFTGATLPKLENEIAKNLFSWGWLGVEIFFVISGFIIPFVLIRSEYQFKDVFAFMGKRIVRIAPPAYVAMFMTIFLYYALSLFGGFKYSYYDALSVAQILHNMAFSIPFTDYKWVNGVFWTLAVEFQFYIFISLVFTLIIKSNFRFIVMVLVLVGCYYLPVAKNLQFLYYSSMFLMGWLALLLIDGRIKRWQFFVLLAFLVMVAYAQLGWMQAIFGGVAALAIVFLSINNAVGAFFGRISYSLYLVHILVGSILEGILVRLISPDTLAIKLCLLLAVFVGTIFLSWIFCRTVECHFMRLANQIFERTQLKEKAQLASS